MRPDRPLRTCGSVKGSVRITLFALFIIALSSVAYAQADFRYYVFDETRNDKLDLEHVHDFSIYHFTGSSPRLVYYTEHRIHGCAQNSFTYTEELCALDVPLARYNTFLAAVRALPLEHLGRKKPRDNHERSFGTLTLDGRDRTISVRLDDPDRAKLHSLILAFLDEAAPKTTRKRTTRTIAGDLTPARRISLSDLLSHPRRFDGRRVRVTGYYHVEFEESGLYTSRATYARHDNKRAIWLGETSTFAAPDNSGHPNDSFITVDGTFDAGPGGHMGAWPGELVRTTRITGTAR